MSASDEIAYVQRVRQIQGFLPVLGTVAFTVLSSPLLVSWHGCEIPDSSGNAGLIEAGMQKNEVIVILGEPNEQNVAKHLWVYRNDHRNIQAPTVVQFDHRGRVEAVSR